MPRIPEEELARLKRETDLAAVVRARGIELRPHGKDLIGHCPFHSDRTASFVVSPAKNLWNCLGACATGGSVIDFLMKIDNVSFPKAVEMLREQSPAVFTGGARHATEDARAINPHANERTLLRQVVEYYHSRLAKDPTAVEYLRKRGIHSETAIKKFKVGFVDRSLGLKLPPRNTIPGREVRMKLRTLGILTDRGAELFSGRIVFPVIDESGNVGEIYARRVSANGKGPHHLYLPGPHAGIWNPEALKHPDGELILCESIIDALTFYVHGFPNVTAMYGTEGFTNEMLTAIVDSRVRRVLMAQDADEAGNRAATKTARLLAAEGVECARINFPKGMDANEFSRKTTPARESLRVLISGAVPTGGPLPQKSASEKPVKTETKIAVGEDIPPLVARAEQSSAGPAEGRQKIEPRTENMPEPEPAPLEVPNLPTKVSASGEIEIQAGDRFYRVRGLERNQAYDVLKVNIRVAYDGGFYLDTLDLYNAKQRANFIAAAVEETGADADMLKRDMGRVVLKLEELQEKRLMDELTPDPAYEMSDEERENALKFLQKPRLLERIADDFEACGLVGERVNSQVAWLAATSRKMKQPLAVIIQSSSSAGKSTLMNAVLDFMPPEDVVHYSAVTGQSLFYLGEHDIKHKILAISEEEGAERAVYALKVLQSEGKLTIASTAKDDTGTMRTREYHVEGPVMVVLTTTNPEINEELQNRCIILSVNESVEQTGRIHDLQRMKRTAAGAEMRRRREKLIALHRNVQRLITAAEIENPFAPELRFPKDRHRMRRDNEKYLTLMDALTLASREQREHSPDRTRIYSGLEDVREANRLAGEVFGHSLDDLSPQTRNFLERLHEWAVSECDRRGVQLEEFRFTRRDIRGVTGLSHDRIRVHMERLVDMEYVLLHRGGPGMRMFYEMLYAGEGENGEKFMTGLIDTDKLEALNARA